MKRAGIFFLTFTLTLANAQTRNVVMQDIGQPTDKTSGYIASPALVKHVTHNQVLLQSTDGGTSWTDLSQGLPEDLQVSQVVKDENEMLLGTLNGDIYTRKTDGNWEKQVLEGKSKDEFIIHIHKNSHGTFACVSNQGLFKRSKDSPNWQHVKGDLENTSIFMLAETPNGSILAACETGIYISTNEGISWTQVYKESWANNIISCQGVWFAYGAKGILRSMDNGETWKCIFEEVAANFRLYTIDGYVVALRQTVPYDKKAYAYSYACISRDLGFTWKEMSTGQPTDQKMFDLEKSGTYLFSSRESGLSRSADLGNTWQLLLAAPENEKGQQFEILTEGPVVYAILKRGGC